MKPTPLHARRFRRLQRSSIIVTVMLILHSLMGSVGSAIHAETLQATAPNAVTAQPLTAAQLTTLLPEKVFFQGQSAPIQLRNAGGTRFGNGAYVLAALVDTSGYSTGVQEKYQFYFITETSVRFGGKVLAPGAYGAGFVAGDHFLVMDIGGHTIAEGSTVTDSGLARPRPLQVLAASSNTVRLYLGRRYVAIEDASAGH